MKKKENIKKEDQHEVAEGMTNEEEVLFLGDRIKELEEKSVRFQAELINYKRRKDEETSRMLKYACEDIITEFLPILDNFERALNVSVNEENTSYKDGIMMIYNSTKNLLAKFELHEINSLNQIFDPTYHQAVMTSSNNELDDDMIVEVLQKGYMYKDKVIRPAMVKVNKKGEMTNE